jgi:hypothetical protein
MLVNRENVFLFIIASQTLSDHTDAVTVCALDSNVVDRGFEHRLGQTKHLVYNIGMCCLTPKHPALRSKNKYCLPWNQNNVSEGVMVSNTTFNNISVI